MSKQLEICIRLDQLEYVTRLARDLEAIRAEGSNSGSVYIRDAGQFGIIGLRTPERDSNGLGVSRIVMPAGSFKEPDQRDRVVARLDNDLASGFVVVGGNGYCSRLINRLGEPMSITGGS